LNTGHSAAPSLVTSGKDAPDTAQGGRILADMEERPAKRSVPDVLSRLRRVFSPITLITATLLLMLPWLFAQWWSTPIPPARPSASLSPSSLTKVTPAPPTSTPDPVTDVSSHSDPLARIGGAMIIDDRPDEVGGEAGGGTSATTSDNTASSRVASTSPPASARQSHTSAPRRAANHPAASSTASSTTSRVNRLDPVEVNNDGTLGPVLRDLVRDGHLSEYHREVESGRNEAIDALMLRIYGETQQTLASLSEPTVPTVSGAPQLPTSLEVQQQLRACPPANTLNGIRCRNEVCSHYAGQDAACPTPRARAR